jgi:hypothetical protein
MKKTYNEISRTLGWMIRHINGVVISTPAEFAHVAARVPALYNQQFPNNNGKTATVNRET